LERGAVNRAVGQAVFGDEPAFDDFDSRRAKWATGWRQAVFPGVFLFYLAATATGVHDHSTGAAAVIGYVILGAFATCYLRALPMAFAATATGSAFWRWFAALVVCFLLEIPLAHEAAFAMTTYIVVLAFSSMGARAWPFVGVIVVLSTFGPAIVPSWHTGVDTDAGVSTSLVALAMYGFFEIIRSNRALSEARAEVARLAMESERSRIARDLHDLLGHSLTTITVKSALANRLAGADPERAATEMREVEALSRQSLADVRAAVSSYREVTLAGELASGRELLRAARIDGDLPGSVDGVRADLHELFGWVVREGLTNVVRHSRARRCQVLLGSDTIEIRDDGVGLVANDPGGGLTGLRERVAAAGGTVSAGPAREGWVLRVAVPHPVPAAPGAADATGAGGGPA
jgi:two-component system sensor histidine kinase DesK